MNTKNYLSIYGVLLALVLTGCGGDGTIPVPPVTGADPTSGISYSSYCTDTHATNYNAKGTGTCSSCNAGYTLTGGACVVVGSLSISPSTALVGSGGTVSFSASGGTGGYTYTTSGGTMSGGTLTAGDYGTVTVTAHDSGGHTSSATVTVKGTSSGAFLSGDTSCFGLNTIEAQCFGYDIDSIISTSVGADGGHDLPVKVASANFLGSRINSFAAAPKGGVAVEWGCFINFGNVSCFGNNTYGALGQGNTVTSVTPQTVTLASGGPQKVVNGFEHACSLHANGNLYCWGLNSSGQVGSATPAANCNGGSDTCALSPQLALANVMDVSAGNYNTCAVLNDNTVKCWGRNDFGQTGAAPGANVTTPTTVPGLTQATAITVSASGKGACAVNNGGLKCWGGVGAPMIDNLGTGLGASAVPSYVSGMGAVSGVTAVASGLSYVCAVQGGLVKCFGFNDVGQLGNGLVADSSSPVTVAGLSGVLLLSGGNNHSCAVTSATHTTYCWGKNNTGQLGQGNNANSNIPLLVSSWQ